MEPTQEQIDHVYHLRKEVKLKSDQIKEIMDEKLYVWISNHDDYRKHEALKELDRLEKAFEMRSKRELAQELAIDRRLEILRNGDINSKNLSDQINKTLVKADDYDSFHGREKAIKDVSDGSNQSGMLKSVYGRITGKSD